MCPALFRGNVCIWSDKISNVSAILGQKSTARMKVNQNTTSPPLSEIIKFRKRMGFSVLGSLITETNFKPKFSATSFPGKRRLYDVCMTGGTHRTPSHTNVCKFLNFQLTVSQLILHLNVIFNG